MLSRKDITTRSSIRTRYHGPTDTLGSRISAFDGRRRVVVPFACECDANQNHAYAAQVFLNKHYNNKTLPPCEVDAHSGLAFDGDYYWSWDIVD